MVLTTADKYKVLTSRISSLLFYLGLVRLKYNKLYKKFQFQHFNYLEY